MRIETAPPPLTWKDAVKMLAVGYFVAVPMVFGGVYLAVYAYDQLKWYWETWGQPELVVEAKERERNYEPDLFDRYGIQPPPPTKFDRTPEERKEKEQERRWENSIHGPY